MLKIDGRYYDRDSIRTMESEIQSWRTVAMANQAAARSHQERWASAEALLAMALPHVEIEGDECLAHMIRQHIDTCHTGPEETPS